MMDVGYVDIGERCSGGAGVDLGVGREPAANSRLRSLDGDEMGKAETMGGGRARTYSGDCFSSGEGGGTRRLRVGY